MCRILPLAMLVWLGANPMWAGLDDLEDINFPLNSAVVVDGFQGLDLLALVMAKHSNLSLDVTGHTDSIGTASYNKKLSLKRAEQVKAYLVSKGADASKIATSGDGISQDHDNASREGRFQNRRVSLVLYEGLNGSRTKVSYKRLIELFCEDLAKPHVDALAKNEEVMKKLTELDAYQKKAVENMAKRLDNIEKNQAEFKKVAEELPKQISAHMKLTKYSGVSFGAGVDDDSDFTGNIKGLYFRPFGEHFAVQAQGDFNYYDLQKEGQVDMGAVFQEGGFRVAAAGSYKWVSIDGLETARIGQGAVMMDWLFGQGKIGVFGTVPFADGDVVSSRPGATAAFTEELYVNVPSQVGLDFGVSLSNKVDLSGYASALDGETDADLGAGLKLDVFIKDYMSWYLQADLNESLLIDGDDSNRYTTGLRFGSWNKARYSVNDQITPVNIPRIRYEILSRTVRTGNTGPIADAGQSRTNVPAGTVNLDGSGSSDPEGDEITFKWVQTGGTSVELTGADQAQASFTGVAGEAYVFQLQVRDSFGESSTDVVSITMEAAPLPQPEIISFVASPVEINEGGISSLTWATQYADEITISGVGSVGFDGTVLVSPEATTEYTLTASNSVGSVSASVTVTVIIVEPPPIPDPVINFFTAIPDTIVEGEFTTLSWSTEHADTVSISGLGQVNADGSLVLAPTETMEYVLTATNEAGSVTASVTVTVIPEEPPPPPNRAPVAHAGADQVLNQAGTVTLDGSASFDPDGDTLTYQWVQVSGRPATLTGADTVNPTFTAEQGSYTFRLIVDDGRGLTDTDEVDIFVVNVKAGR